MFEFNVKKIEDTNYIALQGRIDMANVKACEELFETNMTDVNKIVVNVEGVTFIDSTGVGGLVSAIKSANSKGVCFQIVNAPDGINEIFEITGVYEVLRTLQNIYEG